MSEINMFKEVGTGKIDVSLSPPAAIRAMALAFMAGVKKLGRWPYNWRNSGQPTSRRAYLAAAMRHIQADLDGEDYDQEMTGLLGRPVPHYGAALASLAMLADGMEFGNVIDDRPSSNYERDKVRGSISHETGTGILSHSSPVMFATSPRFLLAELKDFMGGRKASTPEAPQGEYLSHDGQPIEASPAQSEQPGRPPVLPDEEQWEYPDRAGRGQPPRYT